MGLFGVFNQFIEVIEKQTQRNEIISQFPVNKNEIKMGAKLIVREGQVAIFVNEGQIADLFEPGTYELNTQNMPIMTKLKSWKYGFNSPFKAEVYFVNTSQFLDQKWGTPNPIMMRDKDFGIVRIRGFGTFSYKVKDAIILMKEVTGSSTYMNADEMSETFKKQIVSSLSECIAKLGISAIDIASCYSQIGDSVRELMQEKFKNLGFEITSLIVENISLPQEVEKAIDTKTTMGIYGNSDQYAQFKIADSFGQNNNQMGQMQASMMANAMMMNQMGQLMQGFNPYQGQNQGYVNQGVSPQGYQTQGYVNQGISPQGYQTQGYVNQGISPQGYQTQGYVNQGISPQGYQNQNQQMSSQEQISLENEQENILKEN